MSQGQIVRPDGRTWQQFHVPWRMRINNCGCPGHSSCLAHAYEIRALLSTSCRFQTNSRIMSPRNILSYLFPLLQCQSIVFSSENGTQLEYYTVMYPEGRNFTYSRGKINYNDSTAQVILDSHNAARRELNLTALVSLSFLLIVV